MKNETFTPANVQMLSALQGVVPVQQGLPILKDVMSSSLIMQLAKYEEMTASEKEFDVYLGGLGAYWVGEGERIQTTTATWAKVKMVAKKLGVIIPVTREYLTYKQADFFNFYRPRIAEALYKKFDAAVIAGIDNPFEWSIDKSATDRNVEGELDTANYDKMIGNLNDEGYEPNAIVSKVANNSSLRNMFRDENGFKERIYDASNKALDGTKVFDLHKDIEMKKGTLYAGDFNYAYFGIPYNLNYLISHDATLSTITASDGKPVNLFEQEMSALRVTMDVAFMIISDEAFASIKAPAVGG